MVHTLPDIVGAASSLPVVANNVRTPAKWALFTVPNVDPNSADARVGDSFTSATRGAILRVDSQVGILFQPIGDTQYLDLSEIYVYAGSGDIVAVTYAL
jgi:hypothetical protein